MPKHPALQSIQERLNRLFEETLQLTSGDTRFDADVKGWSPPMDIYETESEIVVTAEIAGMQRSDFELELTENTLYLRGDRQPPDAPDSFHRVERHHGTFERSFELPTSVRKDPESIHAAFKNGMLEIRVAKVEPQPVAKIPVKSS